MAVVPAVDAVGAVVIAAADGAVAAALWVAVVEASVCAVLALPAAAFAVAGVAMGAEAAAGGVAL